MKNLKTKIRITRRSLKYALLIPANRTIYGGIFGMGLVTVALFYFKLHLFAGILALLLLAAFGMLVWASLLEYSAAEAHNKFAMLSNWAQAAGTAEERKQRWSLLESNSLDHAWEQSSLSYEGPRFNVDGTRMLPGNSMMDMNGTMYGASDVATASYNPATTSWTDPASAYSNPLSSDTGYSGLASMGLSMSDSSSGMDMSRHD